MAVGLCFSFFFIFYIFKSLHEIPPLSTTHQEVFNIFSDIRDTCEVKTIKFSLSL